MGEIVQKSLEDLIPVFETLERVQLFTSKEIKFVIRKCKDFEYKLVKNERQKKDCASYIRYLINFLALITQRRKLIKYWHKKQEIDKATSVKIDNLFQLACIRYKSDVNLWLSRINFAKNQKMFFNASKIFLAMLQIHSNKESLWILAAKYEFEERNSPDGARSLIQRGLRFVPKSKTLWLELFRFELLFIEKILKRQKTLGLAETPTVSGTNDAVIEGQLVKLVFRQAMLEFQNDAEFCLQFIPIAKQFSFASTILEEVYEYLNLNFRDKEERWQVLIDKEFDEGVAAQNATSAEELQEMIKKVEESCFNMYREATETLKTSKMWRMYADFCIRRYMKTDNFQTKANKLKEINKIFALGPKSKDFLTEDLIFRWLNLSDDLEHQTVVLSHAVETFPKNVTLWLNYLKLMTSNVSESRKIIRKLFNRAIVSVPQKDSLPLWKMAVDWTLVNCPNRLKKLFQDSLNVDSQVASEMKILYLEWSMAVNGMEETRKLFRELSLKRPNSLKFYQTFIKMETCSVDPKPNSLRKCFEIAISECGRDSVEIWKDFMKLETSFVGGRPEDRSKIYDRATKTLREDLVEDFIRDNTLSFAHKFA